MLNCIGTDHLVIGSDCGHNDPSKEPEFVKNLRSREDVAPRVIDKILSENPRTLYGLESIAAIARRGASNANDF